MKLKELIGDWPLDGWRRGSLTWDADPGMLRLAGVAGPDAEGRLELVAGDAQLCRWSNRLAIAAQDRRAAIAAALAGAVGRTLAEAGDVEVDA